MPRTKGSGGHKGSWGTSISQAFSSAQMSSNRMPRGEQRCKMLVKMLDIVNDYFSPNYDVATFLNHEQIIKITESSMKNVLRGNGAS